MPVPPGQYGLKGIYMPAEKWQVDGEYHSVVPRFAGGASSWQPTPEQWDKPEPFGGDPCGQPLADVDVGPNGMAVFYYTYLENGLNNPVFDLNKPSGYEQFQRAFGSGGAGGGSCTATNGEIIWSFSTDGGPKFVYRADGKPFGTEDGRYRPKVYKPAGWVKALACWTDPADHKSYLYVAEDGKIVEYRRNRLPDRPEYQESQTEFTNKVTILAGEDGKKLGEITSRRPQGLVARSGTLYVLQHAGDDKGWEVTQVALQAGLPKGQPERVFAVPSQITPSDIEVDSHGRFYLSDPAANKVYQLSRGGRITQTYGRQATQQPGTYDPLTFMAPTKLATWKDAAGDDRLIIVESAGPNRASEWSADGKLIRSLMSLQTKANDGYAPDSEHPEYIYLAGHQHWLTRFKVDYQKHEWTVDAVWPHVGDDSVSPGLDHPRLIRRNGQTYLACGRSYNVYRLAGDRWVLSAGVITRKDNGKPQYFAWHDANGNGKVDAEECTPFEMPGWLLRYHGDRWLDDLSLIALNQKGPDVWRLAPASFDALGNPVFTKWEKTLTDPIFAARSAGTANALYGGNELDDAYSSDWGQADQADNGDIFVSARGGKSFSANEGAQYKLSRYTPDGKGGYQIKWRTGRIALQGTAKPGEVYGPIHLWRPINGLVSVVDQSRCGVLLYTLEGLYVDSVFPDGRRFSKTAAGLYPQPGEFFAGVVYPNRDNGKVYFGMGKYTPLLFEAVGWSLKDNPVRPLTTLQPNVTLAAADIASPPEIALTLRGGHGSARVAEASPALGGPALDGSTAGWENCQPATFSADKDQAVEVRMLYDPDHLYLRWHVRLGRAFEARDLHPAERIFTHDRQADTWSLYIQADPQAKPAKGSATRPGDARIIFGVFDDGGKKRPVALGLYPAWNGSTKANPVTYRTPVGEAAYANVAEITDAQLAYQMDADGKGLVLTARLPRSAIPGLPKLDGALRTMVNFEATLAGHNKFWWANTDGSASRETYDEPTEARMYSGSWAPLQFASLADGVVLTKWMICGPFGGPEAEQWDKLTTEQRKVAARKLYEATTYPPDGPLDLNAAYAGPAIQGFWKEGKVVRWKPMAVPASDARVEMGKDFQIWYATTWVYAQEAVSVQADLVTSPLAYIRYFVNGQQLPPGKFVQTKGVTADRTSATQSARQTLSLRQGWNEIRMRGYCIGYPPLRAGLTLAGPSDALWTLRTSGNGPSAAEK
jgi:hypothetical protein